MFKVRFTEFSDNYGLLLNNHHQIYYLKLVLVSHYHRYCSTIQALWEGSAGFQVTMYFAGRPRSLWKTSLEETCHHTGCSETSLPASLEEQASLHHHSSFSPSSFLLPGSTALINLLALLLFILLWTDLSWRNLRLYIFQWWFLGKVCALF